MSTTDHADHADQVDQANRIAEHGQPVEPAVPDRTDQHARLKQLLQDRRSPTKGRASRRLDVCLDATLSAAVTEAQQKVAAAENDITAHNAEHKGDVRQGGKIPVPQDLMDRLEEAEQTLEDADAVADAATVSVLFVALKADDFDKLLKEHPPEDGNEDHKEFGANRPLFLAALMTACAQRVEHNGEIIDMEPGDVLDTLTSGEKSMAYAVALEINQRTNSTIPFSGANSQSRQRSGGQSRRP
jgi:hypothetical protein